MSAPLLEVRGLTRWFGGLAAVQGFEIAVAEGQIVGLIGPNGAGKTTIFNLLSGALRPSAGEVRLAGASIVGRAPEAITRLGLARTFQDLRLFRRLTARENVVVAAFCRAPNSLVSWTFPRHQKELAGFARQAEELLEFVDLADKAGDLAMYLSHGQQRRLEVARALATGPRLLLLDEPAGGLGRMESEIMTRLIQRIRSSGVTLVLIEHNMHFLMPLVDRVAVMNFGRKIAEGTPAAIREDPEVVAAYLGTGQARAHA